MKVDKNNNELKVFVTEGLKEVKATISQEKQAKLFELLQAPYSNPIGSIVRETVTNAWDAHVEAGKIAPIKIKLSWTQQSGYYIEFIDNGIGMSEERIYKVYTNYLESTKENTNEQSGYFGIGSKSPLSYASEYFVTTVYENIRYEYIIRKDDDGIPVLTELERESTEDSNGTTIKLYIKNIIDVIEFEKEVNNQLYFFEHVIFQNETNVPTNFVNDFKIIKGEHFVCRLEKSGELYQIPEKSSAKDLKCVIGQVAYELDNQRILEYVDKTYSDDETTKFKAKKSLLVAMNVGIRVGIGDPNISITMTRENIKYKKDTIPFLVRLIEKAYDEIISKNLIDKSKNKFSDIIKLVKNANVNPVLSTNSIANYINTFNSTIEINFNKELMHTFSMSVANKELKSLISDKASKIEAIVYGEKINIDQSLLRTLLTNRINKLLSGSYKFKVILSKDFSSDSHISVASELLFMIHKRSEEQSFEIQEQANFYFIDEESLKRFKVTDQIRNVFNVFNSRFFHTLIINKKLLQLKDNPDDIDLYLNYILNKACKKDASIKLQNNKYHSISSCLDSSCVFYYNSMNLPLKKISDYIECTCLGGMYRNTFQLYSLLPERKKVSIDVEVLRNEVPVTKNAIIIFMSKDEVYKKNHVFYRMLCEINGHEFIPIKCDKKNLDKARNYGFYVLSDMDYQFPKEISRKVIKDIVAKSALRGYVIKPELFKILKKNSEYNLGESLIKSKIEHFWNRYPEIDVIISKNSELKTLRDKYLEILDDYIKVFNVYTGNYRIDVNTFLFSLLKFRMYMREIGYKEYLSSFNLIKSSYEKSFCSKTSKQSDL